MRIGGIFSGRPVRNSLSASVPPVDAPMAIKEEFNEDSLNCNGMDSLFLFFFVYFFHSLDKRQLRERLTHPGFLFIFYSWLLIKGISSRVDSFKNRFGII